MPACEVFISYAHADNPPRYESRDWEHRRGWVECFHTTLAERLRQVRGKPTEIWRDDDAARLSGASVLTDTIRDALHACSVLIAIVSPSYAASQWCAAEFDFFCEGRALRGGLRAGTRLRVLKVNKLPVTGSSFLTRDASVADSVGYPLHRMVDGLPLEFDPPHSGAPGDDFCRRVNALAHDLAAILDGSSDVVTPSGTTIVFGACSPDVRDREERLRSELRQHGHEIVPASAAALARARLSVHVIGATYDAEAVRDYELAGTASAQPFARLSWLPPDVEPGDERQRAFVDRLKLDPHFAATTVTLEGFKSIVRDELGKSARTAAPELESAPDGDVKRVYLVFDPPDQQDVKPLDDWLYQQGFEVVKTVGSANAAAFRKLHNGRLRSSDGVLIYHGHADEQWLESKLDELWKVFSATRQRHPKARGVVLADPETPYKREFRARIARVIPGFGPFDPAALAAFAQDVRRHESG